MQCFYPTRVRGFALLAAGGSALSLSPAYAQQVPSASKIAIGPAEEPDKDRLEEIVVTARRRAELLQRTPVSVIALSAEDLEARSVTNTRNLQNFVPNLTFAPSQNGGEAAGNVFIRGIGQEDFGLGGIASGMPRRSHPFEELAPNLSVVLFAFSHW